MNVHGVAQQLLETILEIPGTVIEVDVVLNVPITPHRDFSAGHSQCVSRRQGSDALKQCRGADRVLEGQVFGERRGVGPDVRQEGQQRLRFRSKEQPATLLAIVEWLDSESIASCEQFLVFLIPDRK